ncbi:hypothetical protein AN958_11917 [Leucoagaricus sp. SymC.cos]|nr:hypothetical protein AN958_11917 [Leucoagaricus sp. SymC.cos]
MTAEKWNYRRRSGSQSVGTTQFEVVANSLVTLPGFNGPKVGQGSVVNGVEVTKVKGVISDGGGVPKEGGEVDRWMLN